MKYRTWRVLLGVAFLLVGLGFAQVSYVVLNSAGYFIEANFALFTVNSIGIIGFFTCIYFAIKGEYTPQ